MTMVYVQYKDHVLFQNTDPCPLTPNIREVVGWVTKETEEALFLTYDRSVEALPYEKCESGLIILKSEIVARKDVGVIGCS